jgi:hypothetical protein
VCPPGTRNPAKCTNVPPVAETLGASNVSATTATLNGIAGPAVNQGDITAYYFQYGTTTGYGSTTPFGSTATCPPGTTNPSYCSSDPPATDVSKSISGLTPATVYHFRIVAMNSDGKAYGADQTFTTRFLGPIKKSHVPKRVRAHHRFSIEVRCNTSSTVIITMRHHGRTIKHIFDGVATKLRVRVTAPGRGRYTVRIIAKAQGVTETINDPLKVT